MKTRPILPLVASIFRILNIIYRLKFNVKVLMFRRHSVVLILMLSMLAQAGCAPSARACPTATSDTKLLTNKEDGYCLLYPAEDVSDTPGWVVIHPILGPGDVPGEAWLYIQVQDAAGRTATQIVDKGIAGLGEGFNISRFKVEADGEHAIVIDGLPGQNSNRVVMIVHNDRLYTLTFQPWQPSAPGQPPLANLYTTVMDSLHFLPKE